MSGVEIVRPSPAEVVAQNCLWRVGSQRADCWQDSLLLPTGTGAIDCERCDSQARSRRRGTRVPITDQRVDLAEQLVHLGEMSALCMALEGAPIALRNDAVDHPHFLKTRNGGMSQKFLTTVITVNTCYSPTGSWRESPMTSQVSGMPPSHDNAPSHQPRSLRSSLERERFPTSSCFGQVSQEIPCFL